MANQKFPDVQSKEWLDLRQRSLNLLEEFKSIKEGYTALYEDFPFASELGGDRQPTIVRKLKYYPGDVTPSMFVSLIKDVEKNIVKELLESN